MCAAEPDDLHRAGWGNLGHDEIFQMLGWLAECHWGAGMCPARDLTALTPSETLCAQGLF